MKFLLLVLPAIIFSGNNAVTPPRQSASDALICAYGNYYGILYENFNTQDLIKKSFNKFIVSNKTTHKCAITIEKITRDVRNCYITNSLEFLRALQTAVPIESCNTQNIKCYDSYCGIFTISACCNGNYCNKAENIIINNAVFYPNQTLAKTKNDSYIRYSNVTCNTTDTTSNKSCIIVNYKNKNFNPTSAEFNAIQNMVNCKIKDPTHEDASSTSNNLICAYSDYYKKTITEINKQDLIAESSNKFIVSNKATHKCGIFISEYIVRAIYILRDCLTLKLLRVSQTAKPIKYCKKEANVRCKKYACDHDVSPCCNGSYCNNANNIIINDAFFYSNKRLDKTAHDSYRRYTNKLCVSAGPDIIEPCIIVNYKNLNLQPSEFNTTQYFIDCDTKNTNPTDINPTDTDDEDNNNSATLNYLNPILIIISFFVSKIY